jgi:hypothetical protein
MTSGDSGTNQPTGRARWQRRITATIVFSAVLAIAAISSCRKEPPAAKNTGQQQANVAQTVPEKATQMNGVKFEPAHAQSKEEQSCQEFVQKFYDWYVSRELEFECKHLKDTHHEDIDSLNSCRRASEFHSVEVMRLEQALSPKLKRLLDDDYAAQAKADEIVGMDGDPFLNGNAGVIYNYVVDSVQVKDGKCNATVNETGINGNGSIQKHRPVERIALDGLEAGVADDSAQLFFRGAVTRARGLDYILFQHHRAYIVAAEVEA